MKNHKMRKSHLSTVLYAVVSALLCLTIFTNCILCGLYAKFKTSVSSSQTARVADFSVSSLTISDGMINLIADNTFYGDKYAFQITGTAEVSVEIIIELVLHIGYESIPWPEGLRAQLFDKNIIYSSPFISNTDNGVFPPIVSQPGLINKDYYVQLCAAEQVPSGDYNVSVRVTVQQID